MNFSLSKKWADLNGHAHSNGHLASSNGHLPDAATIRLKLQCSDSRCECHRPNGRLHCPAHNDSTPSLSVDEGIGGKALLKCFAGCSQDAVIEAVTQRNDYSHAPVLQVAIKKPAARLIETQAIERLVARGLTLNTIKHFRIAADATSQQWQYPIIAAGQVQAVRFKAFDSDRKPKYLWPQREVDARRFFLYGTDGISTDCDHIYLVAGEPDVWIMQQIGLPAVSFLGGEGTIKPEYFDLIREHLPAVKSITAIYDVDQAGRRGMTEALRLAPQHGFEIRALDLSPLNRQQVKGFDLCDLYAALEHEDKAFKKALDQLPEWLPEASSSEAQESQKPRKRFILLHADELDHQPPPTYIYSNEIPAHGFISVFGPSGAGKSFITIDYALTVAQSANVVYVAAEGSSGISVRKKAWCKLHGKGSGGMHVIPQAVPLLEHGAVTEFIATVAHLEPKLIIFDTLARCMVGGDENSARDMGLFIEACNHIQRETGAAVLAVHHTGKNGSSERGSSALRGAADAMIEVSNDDGLITLSCSKTKESKPFAARYLQLQVVDLGTDVNGDPVTSCVAVATSKTGFIGSELSERQRKVLEVLSLETFREAGAAANKIADTAGVPTASLYRTISGLMKLKYVVQHKRGDPFYITVNGIDALDRLTAGYSENLNSHPILTNSHSILTNSHSTLDPENPNSHQFSPILTNSHPILTNSHPLNENSTTPILNSHYSHTPLRGENMRIENSGENESGNNGEKRHQPGNDAGFEPYGDPPSNSLGVQNDNGGIDDLADDSVFDAPLDAPVPEATT